MRSPAASDRRWLEQVMALAALGEATARPNPRVGCIVVRDGVAVGWGWHRSVGGPHAEVAALDHAGPRAKGATLYVNLEPCAHHGRTPPCVERVIESGIARVVASIRDPNPLVDGRGFDALRSAGVRVEVGALAASAEALNATFLHWHRTGRPRVTVKTAVSVDGRTAARDGRSRWITGEPARRFAHRLRLRHDAILVGAETVRHDDPALDVRLDGVERASPLTRAVLSATGRLPRNAKVFRDDGAPVIVYVREGREGGATEGARGRGERVAVPSEDGTGLDLGAVLRDLGSRGVQSVLVEGGAHTAGRFVAAGLADAFVMFQAPSLIGARAGRPTLDVGAVSSPSRAPRLRVRRRFDLGEDHVVVADLGGPREG